MSDALEAWRRRMAFVRAALKSSAPTAGGVMSVRQPAKPADAPAAVPTSAADRGVAPAPVIPPPTAARGKTFTVKQLRAEQRREVRLFGPQPPLPPVERPKVRGDCEGGDRPCPLIGCRHHNAVEVSRAGSLHVNRPDLEAEEHTASCSLDVADAGPLTLEQTGQVLGLTRERVRQVETMALHKVKVAVESKMTGSCRARCAETGLYCRLPAHPTDVAHRNERGPFQFAAVPGQTQFAQRQRLEEHATRNADVVAVAEGDQRG